MLRSVMTPLCMRGPVPAVPDIWVEMEGISPPISRGWDPGGPIGGPAEAAASSAGQPT